MFTTSLLTTLLIVTPFVATGTAAASSADKHLPSFLRSRSLISRSSNSHARGLSGASHKKKRGIERRSERRAKRLSDPSNLAQGSLTSTEGCTQFYSVVSGDICYTVARTYGLDLTSFYAMNPDIDSDCQNLNAGSSYCVAQSTGSSSAGSSSATASPTFNSTANNNVGLAAKSASRKTTSVSFASAATTTPSSSSKGKKSSATTSSTSSKSTSSSSSSSSAPYGIAALAKLPKLPTDIHVGWVPADGSSGPSETISTILDSIGQSPTCTQGYYAQVTCDSTFTGSQLTSRMSDILKAGGIFQPAVMPLCWDGFTPDNNYQAVAVCKVMKQFTDQGLEVWLRFAHEANWYQTDGTYQPGVDNFLTAWKTVHDACESIAPDVKMFWTPNVANDAQYAEYYPGKNYVDVCGVDYYPNSNVDGDFINKFQNFHDTYTSDTVPMAQGETAISVYGGVEAQLPWLEQMTSQAVADAMPNFKAISWFNFHKEMPFKIANVDGDSATKAFLANQK